MEYTTLGRTGLRVSVAGLGCGGFSRLGLNAGLGEDHAIGIVRQALDYGVNIIDTASVYGTEEVVGKALRGVPRDSVVICTKTSKPAGDKNFSVNKILESLDGSLQRSSCMRFPPPPTTRSGTRSPRRCYGRRRRENSATSA
jgi:L-galactose dehydrogenase